MSKPHLIYEFGPYQLDVENYRLLRCAEELGLRGKPFDLLVILARHPGQTLTKEELLDAIWKDTAVEEGNLAVCVTKLRKILGENYIETVAGRGYRFAAEVKMVTTAMPAQGAIEPGPPNGALPPGDPRYVARPTDAEFWAAVQRRDSLVLVKGTRQVGKSSLLARALQQARQSGFAVVQIDLQSFSSDVLLTIDRILLALGNEIAHQLELDGPAEAWDRMLGSSMGFVRYLEREIFAKLDTTLVCGLDEVDRLLTYPYASDVFGLFRSWHNRRALDPAGPWSRFTLALAYATEPHLFIKDLNQSPFNVGTRLTLSDFNDVQVAELNRHYGTILSSAELEHYVSLLGGHPYLLQSALHAKKRSKIDLEELEAQADRNEGPFGDHLNRMFSALRQDSSLCEAVRRFLREQSGFEPSDFYRLRTAGVLAGDSGQDARLRCELYARFLRKRLL